MDVKLSLLVAARNDNWESEGDNAPLARLTYTLKLTLPRLIKGEEIVLVDWGSEVKLADALPPELTENPKLRIAYVSPARAASCGSSFSEVHALNYAARVAAGEWLGRIDADTLAGDEFFQWFRGEGPQPGSFYFSNRRDMAPGQLRPIGCEPTDYPCNGLGFWRWSVGILLVAREHWHRVRGYDEREVHRQHIEHNFCVRLNKTAKLVNLGAILGCPFFHLSHPRNGHATRPQNKLPTPDDLARVAEVVNGDGWGLADLL